MPESRTATLRRRHGVIAEGERRQGERRRQLTMVDRMSDGDATAHTSRPPTAAASCCAVSRSSATSPRSCSSVARCGVVLEIAGRPISTLDIILFVCFIPLWPLIGISMRAYHPHSVGRGLSITVSDEFATVFRVSTMWSWFLVLARSLATPSRFSCCPRCSSGRFRSR